MNIITQVSKDRLHPWNTMPGWDIKQVKPTLFILNTAANFSRFDVLLYRSVNFYHATASLTKPSNGLS